MPLLVETASESKKGELSPVSKHQIQSGCGEWAGWCGTGRSSLNRKKTKLSGKDRENWIFPVQRTTSRIGNHTPLTPSVLKVKQYTHSLIQREGWLPSNNQLIFSATSSIRVYVGLVYCRRATSRNIIRGPKLFSHTFFLGINNKLVQKLGCPQNVKERCFPRHHCWRSLLSKFNGLLSSLDLMCLGSQAQPSWTPLARSIFVLRQLSLRLFVSCLLCRRGRWNKRTLHIQRIEHVCLTFDWQTYGGSQWP